MVAASGSGHAGGALSCVRTDSTLFLYNGRSRENPKLPKESFVLSAPISAWHNMLFFVRRVISRKRTDTYGCLGGLNARSS